MATIAMSLIIIPVSAASPTLTGITSDSGVNISSVTIPDITGTGFNTYSLLLTQSIINPLRAGGIVDSEEGAVPNPISQFVGVSGNYDFPLEKETYDLKGFFSQNELSDENLQDFVYDGNTNAWSAFNSAQSLEIRADETGTNIISRYGTVSFSLLSVGREDNPVAAESGVISADGRMLEIIRPDYKEWYLNGDFAPEQGMTINKRPDGRDNLIIAFEISGDFLPVLNGDDLIFFDESGSVLDYSGLKAWDAEGRTLDTSLSLLENTLFWEVDDKDAVYPVMVDPVMTQVAELSSTGGVEFGRSVSISGDYAVVGDHGHSAGGISNAGQAYVFYRDAGGDDKWGQVALLNASDKSTDARFGYSVSVSGDYAVVGSTGGPYGIGAQKAYVFYRNQGGADNWGEVAILNGSGGFGFSVSISGDDAVVGTFDGNKAYVFYRNQGGADNWGQVKTLSGSGRFGWSVSVSGDNAVVGAAYDSSSGRAYVFSRNQGGADNWGQVKTLSASDKSNDAGFGCYVSVSGDDAVVGAHNARKAYQFSRNQGGTNNWGQVGILQTSTDNSNFGWSVSVSGDDAVVGAYGSNKAYVFYELQAPTFTGITPVSGPTTGGTSVTITGTNFFPGGSFGVTIGGLDATGVYVDATTITATTA
ncbi:MAG: IPT/TIG domain-containing protein, partial [Methanomicrobiaceae archaeon]|nr:IPT/TIG domain-containing protein [Methanomicrobiaceae archaeon]